MPSLITLSEFIEDVENGFILDIFSITVSNEKRIYGKTKKGQAFTGKQFIIVYAVVP